MTDEFKSIAAIEKMERRKAKRSNRNSEEIMEFLKNTLIMLVIALVAGGVLGFVYELTKEPIATMAEKEKQAANRKVFANAESFSDSIIASIEDTSKFKAEFPGADINDCIQAFDKEGNLLGFVLETVTHEGYGGDIVFSIGIMLDGTINGIAITDIDETPGLGMRAEEVLVPQFKNRFSQSFEVTKTGAVMENQIDAISSATKTSKAITNGVNASLMFFREYLLGGEGHES